MGVFFCGPIGRYLGWTFSPRWLRPVEILVGLLLVVAGFVVANQARADLGDSLRVAPSPLDDAQLMEHGWYGRVRHPLYFAVLLVVTGWVVLWLSLLAIPAIIAVVVFFYQKARHEEQLLLSTYKGYAEYMKRVQARFVPKVW